MGGYKTATKRLSSLTVLFNWDDGNTLEERERGGYYGYNCERVGVRNKGGAGLGGRGSWGGGIVNNNNDNATRQKVFFSSNNGFICVV